MSFMGKDGFIWWIGVVENRKDPLYLGRCKVRILGWHTKNKNDMPTDELPWCFPIQPITSAAQTQVGTTPLGPVEGTWVIGFYRDGERAQEPMMFGTFGGIPQIAADSREGFNDPRGEAAFDYDPLSYDIENKTATLNIKDSSNWPRDPDYDSSVYSKRGGVSIIANREAPSTYPDDRYLRQPTTNILARGNADTTAQVQDDPNGQFIGQSILKIKENLRDVNVPRSKGGVTRTEKSFNEPSSFYNALYPYNHVQQSESGHIFEIDDTPRSERLHWFHRSGTSTEIGPDGTKVEKVINDKFESILKNSYEHVHNTKITTVQGAYELAVGTGGKASQDFAVQVQNGGNITLEATAGNVNINAGGKTLTLGARDVVFEVINSFTFTSAQLTHNVGDYNISTQANSSFSTAGTYRVQSNALVLGSVASTTLQAKTLTHTITEASVENIQSTPLPPPPLGPVVKYAKVINATTGAIKLETVDSAVTGGIELNTGLAGVTSQFKLGITGDIIANTSIGNIKTTAVLGNIKTIAGKDIKTTAGTNFTVDAGTEIEFKNLSANIKMDAVGLISIKGAASDIHTLLKKLSMALQNMSLVTPPGLTGGPTTSIINLSEFIAFDAEIDKVFKSGIDV